MFKKIIAVAFCLICGIFAFAFYQTPAFNSIATEFTFYTDYSDSRANAVRGDKSTMFFLNSVTGESCEVNKSIFNVKDLEKAFSTKLIAKEELPFCTVYYYSSREMKYKKIIDGKEINMQIVEYNDKIIVGTPIIFGSF